MGVMGVTVALVVGVVGLGVTGRLGVTSGEANEGAVRVNYRTGVETVTTTPGGTQHWVGGRGRIQQSILLCTLGPPGLAKLGER